MAWEVWLTFFGAAIAISVSPGAGAIQSMATGLTHGVRRGYWSILGLEVGLMLQLALVAIGLGAAVANSILAFNIIKWLGVAYLVYLAVRQWRTATVDLREQVGKAMDGVEAVFTGADIAVLLAPFPPGFCGPVLVAFPAAPPVADEPPLPALQAGSITGPSNERVATRPRVVRFTADSMHPSAAIMRAGRLGLRSHLVVGTEFLADAGGGRT